MSYRRINQFRKTHRYLGLFIGIQFLFWTISGLYFSWTDIDKIHGDHYRKVKTQSVKIPPAFFLDTLLPFPIHRIEAKAFGEEVFLWINDSLLVDPQSGKAIAEISKEQALWVVKENILSQYIPKQIERIEKVGPHDEYRGRPLPAYRIRLTGDGAPVAYVEAKSGAFQRIRHNQWRWFDFLWMTHTMDYQGRDNFNTLLLRSFSLLGLITVLSGFALAFVTRSWFRKKGINPPSFSSRKG